MDVQISQLKSTLTCVRSARDALHIRVALLTLRRKRLSHARLQKLSTYSIISSSSSMRSCTSAQICLSFSASFGRGNLLCHMPSDPPGTMLLILSFLLLIPSIYAENPLLTCVNPTQSTEWAPPTLRTRIDPYGCAYAIHGLEYSLKGKLNGNLTFYSKLSSQAPVHQGAVFGLPYYARSSTSLASQSPPSLSPR